MQVCIVGSIYNPSGECRLLLLLLILQLHELQVGLLIGRSNFQLMHATKPVVTVPQCAFLTASMHAPSVVTIAACHGVLIRVVWLSRHAGMLGPHHVFLFVSCVLMTMAGMVTVVRVTLLVLLVLLIRLEVATVSSSSALWPVGPQIQFATVVDVTTICVQLVAMPCKLRDSQLALQPAMASAQVCRQGMQLWS